MKRLIILLCTIFTLSLGLSACTATVHHKRPPAPAAKKEMRPSKPRPGAVWVPGHWDWKPAPKKYVWKSGHWR